MWIVLIALLVAVCAVLAANGFKGRVTVVGIDLGTTYSVVGVNEGGVVRIISAEDGSYLVPSMVSFLRSGEVAVGTAARQLAGNDTATTIYEAKRLIGREFPDEEDLLAEGTGRPFRLVRKPFSEDPSDAWFDLQSMTQHPAAISPQGIGTMVVRELLRMVHLDLGHTQVRAAVIAVPAKFDARQRRATAQAFQAAGLKVVRVLEEPTAAALAYGLQNRDDVHHVLVYDFGGGTLDVSLLYVAEGSVQVITSDGDDALGGGDFDRAMASVLVAKLAAGGGGAPEGCAPRAACAFDAPACALSALRGEAERVKQELSTAEAATARCVRPAAAAAATLIGRCPKACAAWELTEVAVTREEFEAAAAPLFERALAAVDRLMEKSGHDAGEIQEAVMVGGTSRMPRVRADLQRRLRLSHLNTHIDPDVTVAYGAATVAH
ncbi:heat shock protein 70 family [Tribonema minus]|uniref:Heat shock protein 70 family n=1 Tax=Tribonema minus TaxID=303371 RepID=A0A835Z661_9STRA|nr:heat shock protein 70 family [Tribonema minus]